MLTEYNSYAIFFISNKRDLYLKCYSKKEITPKRFYNLIDNIVSKCLNDDFVGAIHHATKLENTPSLLGKFLFMNTRHRLQSGAMSGRIVT